MTTMRISFHADPVVVADLSADLKTYGCVYWPTTRPNFEAVSNQIDSMGVDVVRLCARPGNEFLNFLVRTDLVTDASDVEARVAKAINEWVALGAPVPSVRSL